MDALPSVRRCSWWVPAVREETFFSQNGGPSDGSPLSGGGIIILRVIRRHFLVCEDIAGGYELSAGGTFFFAKYRGPFGGSSCQVKESLFCV